MKLFDLSVKGVVLRFYLMMAVVALGGFFGQFVLATILGMTVAVSFILGIRIEPAPTKRVARSSTLTPHEKDQRMAA
ncbi:MAG: hypothetical protein R2824_30325 [Saprospiraceae bacterium]